MRVKEVVLAAQQGLLEVFPEADGCALRLEGVEKSDDSRFWQVTFSYVGPDESPLLPYRAYRTVKLRNEDGEFMGARNGFLTDAA